MPERFDRRQFLGALGAGAATWAFPASKSGNLSKLPGEWLHPKSEFSQVPFWFWNDDLSEPELLRQIEDFQTHGVHAFLIHPRAGLPRSIGWMSARMIHFMRFAIERASERSMWVILYDEGMYPSGSSSGQVAASNPAFRTRGLVGIDLDDAMPGAEVQGVKIGIDREPELAQGQSLVAIVRRKVNGHRVAVVDRAARDGYSVIRGLHFTEEDPPRRSDHKEVPEDLPAGGDILNPDAVACFIRLVYQKYYDEFGEHFGKTIKAIFTDEPSLLARQSERGMAPGTSGILAHVNAFLGLDFTEHLPALFYDDEPESTRWRRDYHRALRHRLDETFYGPINRWCGDHGIALTGHPDQPDDIGNLRYFHIPGQDIVYRFIEPGKASVLEGNQSTQAKCASSAMIHLKRRRNMNECYGAYGHNLTFEEMKFVANWLFVRGCNMLVPHAFYYSVRGPRIDERPPDVGPNSRWWPQYKPFAEATSRLSWLNTDSRHICGLAILGLSDHLSWKAAKVCFQHQRDFNYLEARHLWEDAKVDASGIRLAGMHYRALILEEDPPDQAQSAIDILAKAGRVIRWNEAMPDPEFISAIDKRIAPDVQPTPGTLDVRVRHVLKGGTHYYLLFNEGQEALDVRVSLSAKGSRALLDAFTGNRTDLSTDQSIHIPKHAMQILAVLP